MRVDRSTGQLVGIWGFALAAAVYSIAGIIAVAESQNKKDEKTAHEAEITKDISFYVMVIFIGVAVGFAGIDAASETP